MPGAFRCLVDELDAATHTAALIAVLEAARGAGLAPRGAVSESLNVPAVLRAIAHEDESVAISALRFVTTFAALCRRRA